MAIAQVQLDPIYSLPFLYAYGMVISNDATTPNTKLNIGAGQVRDSNDNIDMPLGASNLPLNGSATATPLVLDAGVNGVNGLDTGSLAASTMYGVWVIGDSQYKNAVGAILTLASNSQPLMPLGYDSMRLIGYWPTDASSHFLKAYMSGIGTSRLFVYDAPQATAVTAGNATSYTAVALTAFVPPVENTPVSMAFAFTPGAASRVLNLTPGNATGNAVTITGQVTSVVVSGNAQVLSKVTSAVPEVDYKVSNSGDAVALNVAGFSFNI